MNVKQIAQFVNDATLQALGVTEQGTPVTLIKEDLSNVVDVGNAVYTAGKYEAYLEALINRIGRTIFVERVYQGKAPRVLRDGWEYGSVMQKISGDLSEASDNPAWDLVNGASYDQDTFVKPKVEAKFYNSKTTLCIKNSITRKQLKQSFTSAGELNRFIEMLYTWIKNSMTVLVDELILRTINNMTAETLYAKYGTGAQTAVGDARAVNLLASYKVLHPATTLTAATCLYDPDFLRFVTGEMGKYIERMQQMSRVFNLGHRARFTPRDLLHVVLHTDLIKNTDTYLSSTTFHEEFNKLPMADIVSYWQGSGDDYDPADTMSINVKTAAGHEIAVSGLLGVMFDHDALGVLNEEAYTDSHWNAAAEFWNEWHKKDAEYFNDMNEAFVAFFVA